MKFLGALGLALALALGVGGCAEDDPLAGEGVGTDAGRPDAGGAGGAGGGGAGGGGAGGDPGDAGRAPDAGALPDAGAPPDAAPSPYPAADAWGPTTGPGLGGQTFAPEALFVECAAVDVGPDDRFQHRNLVAPFDGLLMMPWAPEFGLVSGLSFFDLSAPCAPARVGHATTDQMRETHTVGFAEIGGRSYTATAWMKAPREGGVMLWDVTDPTAPVVVSTLATPGFRYPDAYGRIVFATAWQGPWLYVAAADSGLFIVDARDPLAPVLAGSYPFEPVLRAGQVAAVGDLLVVSAAEGARTVLLDISDPVAPQPIAGGDFLSRDVAGEPRDAYFSSVAGGYIYYARKEAGGGVLIYDLHDPARPTFAGELVSEGNGGYVFVQGHHAFVGESNFAAIYDLSDLGAITEVARLHLKGDLDTATPYGQFVLLAVDDKADPGRGTVIAPWQASPDVAPPEVTWLVPGDGAELEPGSRIGLTFDKMVEPRSVFAGSVRLFRVPDDLGPDDLDPDGLPNAAVAQAGRVEGWLSTQEGTVNFVPRTPLTPGATYQLVLPAGGVTDVSGNALAAPFSARFRVRGGALSAVAGPAQAADVGAEVILDGSASAGAVAWQWDFGDGRRQETPSADPVARVRYDAPGRYRATLTVYDEAGGRRTAGTLVTVTAPPVWRPSHSASVIALPRALDRPAGEDPGADDAESVADATDVAAVSTDGATLSRVTVAGAVAEAQGPVLRWQVPTCAGPRTVAAVRWSGPGLLAVACPAEDAVAFHAAADGAPRGTLRLRHGAAPFGVVGDRPGPDGAGRVWVSLQGTGVVAALRVTGEPAAPALAVAEAFAVGADLRGLARLPGGRLAVSRWRSTPAEGALYALDPATAPRVDPTTTPVHDAEDLGPAPVPTWPLAFDPQIANDTEIGGVPGYLDVLAVRPTGTELAAPGLVANRFHGLHFNGEPLDFDRTVRAMVAFVDLPTGAERFAERVQFDGRGLASAAAWSPRGDYIYVAMRGSRTIERLDRLDGTASGTLHDTGAAVEGLAVVGDRLVADASLDRALRVYALEAFGVAEPDFAVVPLVAAEPLPPAVHRGKVLFNDSADPRLSRDGYLACAHCHLDGDSDRIVWDFTDRGEGLRNTISLRGRAGLGHGPLHWSANFDEVHDFEHDLRGPFGGLGLLDDADFHAVDPTTGARRDAPLGAPKAGLSPDLDALAAYVTSLDRFGRSPWRAPDGALAAEAVAGAALFEDLGCDACHLGEALTDSAFVAGEPVLHPVGALPPSSGRRLDAAPLVALDTPTVRDLAASSPYRHDGSAPDLAAVLAGRDPTDPHALAGTLPPPQAAALIRWLLSL